MVSRDGGQPRAEGAARHRGLCRLLAFWAMVGFPACGLGVVFAIVGLGYSVVGLVRSAVVGGRSGALRGLALNAGTLAVNVLLFYLTTIR
jgi:hypothetical protein